MLRKKSLVVVIFTIFVMNFCNLNGFAIEQQNYVSAIMEQVKEQGNYSDNEIANAKIINADIFTGINPFSSNEEKSSDKFIEICTIENNMLKKEVIMPSKITENGDIMNSFAYAQQLPETSKDFSIHDYQFTDAIVYVTVYYGFWQDITLTYTNYYQPFGITTRWTTITPGVQINNLYLDFTSTGLECYNYGDFSPVPGIGIATYVSAINKGYPTENTVYTDWSGMMPDDRCLALTKSGSLPDGHAGRVHASISYNVNGTAKPLYTWTFTIFSK